MGGLQPFMRNFNDKDDQNNIAYGLEFNMTSLANNPRKHKREVQVNRGLEVINRYCETVFLGLIDDALSCCSFIVVC